MVTGLRRQPAWALIPAAFAYLLWLTTSTGQWFFADEWEFITTRSRVSLSHFGDFVGVMMRPHNEHWSTIPIILYRAVFGVVGLRAYWPYLVVLLALHCAVAALLVRLLARHGVDGWFAFAVAAVFLFYGAGSENILWAFQIGWMGSLAFGLVLLEILSSWSSARIRLAWVVGIAALMCSGVGISMVAAGALTTLIRRRSWRDAARVASVPAIAQIVWFIAYGRNGGKGNPIDWSSAPYGIAGYAWRSIVSTIDRTTGLIGVGAVVVVALVVGVARQGAAFQRVHAEVIALATASTVFLAFVGLSRIGYDYPEASRYSYVIFVMIAPLAAVLARDGLRSAGQGLRWVATGLAVVTIAFSFGGLRNDAQKEGRRERKIHQDVVAAFGLARSSFAAPDAIPDPFSGDLTMAGIRALLAQGIAPNGRATPQAVAEVTARTSVDVTVQPRVPLAPDALVIAALGRVTAQPIESGCVGFFPAGAFPQVSLLPRRPTSFKVVPLVSGTLLVTVKRDGRAAPPLQTPVAANNPVFLNLADPRNEYIVGFPPDGETKVCGIGQKLPS